MLDGWPNIVVTGDLPDGWCMSTLYSGDWQAREW